MSGRPGPGVRQVRARLRRLRRRHHRTSFGDVLTDLYMLALLAALYGWVLADMSRSFLRSPLVGAGDPAEQRWLLVAAMLTAAGFGWAGLRAMGPVFVGPALQSWVASAPVDRRALLLPRFTGLLAGATATVAVLGFLPGPLSGFAGGPGGTVHATLLGAATGLLAGAGAVVMQGARRARGLAELPGRVLIGAGALTAAAVVALHFTGTAMVHPGLRVPAAVPPLVFLAAGTAVVFAVRALARVDRAVTTTGAQFAGSAAAAAVMLDPTLIADLLEVRRWRAIGRVRSRRFHRGPALGGPPRAWALVQAELRRAVRRRGALLGWAALVLVQYAVALAVPGLAGPAHVLTTFLAGDRLAGGLRAITRSPGLRRALGGGDTALKLAHLVVPALAATLFFLVTTPVAGTRPLWTDAVLLAGAVGAVYRSGTRRAMVYDGPVVETPFGLIPADLLRQLGRGWDVVALLIVVDLIATG
ncbi:DUF6297 family protein [Catenuloplanes atrovinosus]|uniref:Uncharacterized protein n=1 Tax=Catenuloplanes atrovinosus TaxID=137266 RepID=A0AAE3YSY0_9ACTN|nr:DUF6297 family protein [Catenuloplanes atrovinosus]MDR7278035.1 hypothetical protein [Catenuloplanes atrovinosus]